jgi:hypothetical protein
MRHDLPGSSAREAVDTWTSAAAATSLRVTLRLFGAVTRPRIAPV